jgi:hypothetical protein
MRIRSDVRPDHSNQDGSAIKWLLIEKLAAAILELADRGHAQGTAAAAGEILTPLVGLGIVEISPTHQTRGMKSGDHGPRGNRSSGLAKAGETRARRLPRLCYPQPVLPG